LETIVQYEIAEEQWPLALNVLKHSQFPWLIVKAIGILCLGRKEKILQAILIEMTCYLRERKYMTRKK
jgi:hypothetical protein